MSKESIFNFIAGVCFALILTAIYNKYKGAEPQIATNQTKQLEVPASIVKSVTKDKEHEHTTEQVLNNHLSLEEDHLVELEDSHNDTNEESLTLIQNEDDLIEEEESSIEIIDYVITSGDTLSSIWDKFGLNATSVMKAAEALKDSKVRINSLVQVGAKIQIKLEEEQITQFSREFNEGHRISLNYSLEDAEYQVEKTDPKVLIEEVKISAEVEGSIAATAEAIGVPYDMIDEFADIFSSKVEFSKDIHPGDSFTLIYDQRKLLSGKQLRPGKLRAAELLSQGKTYRAVNIPNKDGKNNYYDQDGVAIGNFFLRYPVKFTRISSVFSKNRFHPVHKTRRPHNGTDFAAPTGTPVRAVADAKIITATYHKANGNWIKLQHSPRYATAYLHLSKIAKGIRKGGKVARGTVIGYVGSTGYSTGPHLHYSFYDNGKYVDPLKVKLPVLDSQKVSKTNQVFSKYLKKLKS